MLGPASILELRRRSIDGIYAVPYRSQRTGKVQQLPDGSIVETPTTEQRHQAPDRPAPCLELAVGGGAATIHHVCLGLVDKLLPLDGVCVLPSGDVAAIYGAEVVEIGSPACPRGQGVAD